MTTELEERYYNEQVPQLLSTLERIAVALEQQAKQLTEGRRIQEQRTEREKMRHDAAADERRKTIAKQLSQLGEVEKMAAELKRRMESKQFEKMKELAAQKRAAGSGDAGEPADQPSADGSGESAEAATPPEKPSED